MGPSNGGISDDDEDDVDGSPAGGARRVVSEERKDLWKFHISIKLEKMDVRAERCSRGSGVSKDAIMGVRKCCKSNSSING